MDYQSFLELVRNRRSIRRFKSDPIPNEYVEKIIDAARWAPSGFNTQPWEFVVVKKPELKESIVSFISDHWVNTLKDSEGPRIHGNFEANPESMSYSNAPVFILLLLDYRAKVGLPEPAQADPQQLEKIFLSSGANAFLLMHLAAAALGLASQWVSGSQFPSVQRKIKPLLHIPDELDIYDMMALGVPALKPRPKLVRISKEIIHFDDNGDFRNKKQVEDYARRTNTWATATQLRKADEDV